MSSASVYNMKSSIGTPLYVNANNSNTLTSSSNIRTPAKMLKYQNIAPAPPIGQQHNVVLVAGADGKTRKYMPRVTNVPYNVDQTQSVQRRNARERNRVKQVNNSFAKLRQHIPQTIIADLTKGGGRGPQKKISKVDTLRIAVEYIRRLQDLVDDLNRGSGSSSSNNNSNNISFNFNSNDSNNSFSTIASSPSPVSTPAASAATTASTQLYYSNVTSPLQAVFQQGFQQKLANTTFPAAAAAAPIFSSTTLLTPVSLQAYSPPPTTQTNMDNVCNSPTSSFNSNMSFDSGTFESTLPEHLSPVAAAAGEHERHHTNNNNANGNNNNTHLNLQLKFEPYDNFNLQEEDCTPDDEEILDYISLWQDQ